MLQITNFWASLHNVHSLHNYFIVDAFNPSKFYQKQLQWLTPSDCIFKSLFLGKLKAGVQRTTVKLRAVPLNNSDEREKKKNAGDYLEIITFVVAQSSTQLEYQAYILTDSFANMRASALIQSNRSRP
jgi:hypothetical protein